MKTMAMTYPYKITGVVSGTITQTIRRGYRYAKGDWILVHGRSGREWSFYVRVCEVITMEADEAQLWVRDDQWTLVYPWDSRQVDELARLDGIVPPLGVELKRVLSIIYGELPKCLQAIRWKPSSIVWETQPTDPVLRQIAYDDGQAKLGGEDRHEQNECD